MTATIPAPTKLRLITTNEYHRMAEVGILSPDERVELIAGQIIQKMPKGPRHSALCKRIEKLIERLLGDKVLVRLQDPIQLDLYSEPEPDIVVAHPNASFYVDHHPTPNEIYLIVEIADSTIERDLGFKADLYAAVGVADYWVLNVQAQQLHIFRQPQADGYQRQMILKGQQSANLLAFPECSITVQSCFG
ncbi:Uma2 family endonuclease [Synechococcus sp. PCC 7335]|uniref:Uma2 family endonuclease n=1 Tax=Synechococcus sp. (strain ATCC 29403 / PCC 7335) TaxID=91464 RepID=UPI00056ED3C9|nr:Uma2 family endonuclease [Synechococcus sp. PCC 7335]